MSWQKAADDDKTVCGGGPQQGPSASALTNWSLCYRAY